MANENNNSDFDDDYYRSNVDYDKEYNKEKNANKKLKEKVVETRSGPRIEQTYINDEGYTFTFRQKKKGGKITYIEINKPNGDKRTTIRLSNNILKIWEETSSKQRKKIMQDLPYDVAENGASLAEIYKNFEDYKGSSVPYDEKTLEEVAQEEATAPKEMDPYFADVDFDFTIEPDPHSNTHNALQAQRTVEEYELERKIKALQTNTAQDRAEANTGENSKTIDTNVVTSYVRASKDNTH